MIVTEILIGIADTDQIVVRQSWQTSVKERSD
jgi:hypothetical protein